MPPETTIPRRGTTTEDPAPRLGVGADGVPTVTLTLAYHRVAARIGERFRLRPGARPGRVAVSRLEPSFAAVGGGTPRALDDRSLSRRPLWVSRVQGGVTIERDGCPTPVEVDGVPLGATAFIPEQALTSGVVLAVPGTVVLVLHLSREWAPSPDFGLVGASDAVCRLRADIALVAEHDLSTLLVGPSGVGKELVARAIHQASGRAGGPWISLNMAAVPESTAVSQLFGHARGAFTGATAAASGYFAAANGGTLFLDEVGEAPHGVQVMLLRALESGEIQPVGVSAARRVDVRLVAATDCDLEAAARRGDFNPPLFHRLAGFQIAVPRLAERRDDIGRLTMHFARLELQRLGEDRRLAGLGEGAGPLFPAWLFARLVAHDWPGNVRELRNTVGQMLLLWRSGRLDPADPRWERLLPPPARRGTADAAPALPARVAPQDLSEDELVAALEANDYRLGATARQLGISRTTLYALIERSGEVRKASELDRDEVVAARDRAEGDVRRMASALRVSRQGLMRRMRSLGLPY